MTAMREVTIMVTNVEEDWDGNPVDTAAEDWGSDDGQRHRS